MGTFAAVAILFPFVAALYIVVLGIFYISFKRYEGSLLADESETESALQRLFSYDFKSTYQCVFGEAWNMLLLVTRAITFLYYFAIGLVYFLTLELTGWNYFTNWNIYLLCFYFLCATTCSVIGVVNPEWTTATEPAVAVAVQPETASGGAEHTAAAAEGESRGRRPPSWLSALNVATHVAFEVSGATALFVTVVNFTMLSADMTFWNMTQHLFTTAVYLFELTLNVLPVYMLHFPLNITWAVMYLVFTWIVVGVGLRFWPYEFLRADNLSCIIWYSALLIMNFFFYSVWFFLSKWKFGLLTPTDHSALLQQEDQQEAVGAGGGGGAVHRVSNPEEVGEVQLGASVELPARTDMQLAATQGHAEYEAVLGDEAL